MYPSRPACPLPVRCHKLPSVSVCQCRGQSNKGASLRKPHARRCIRVHVRIPLAVISHIELQQTLYHRAIVHPIESSLGRARQGREGKLRSWIRIILKPDSCPGPGPGYYWFGFGFGFWYRLMVMEPPEVSSPSPSPTIISVVLSVAAEVGQGQGQAKVGREEGREGRRYEGGIIFNKDANGTSGTKVPGDEALVLLLAAQTLELAA